jgi:hypothetical protein
MPVPLTPAFPLVGVCIRPLIVMIQIPVPWILVIFTLVVYTKRKRVMMVIPAQTTHVMMLLEIV